MYMLLGGLDEKYRTLYEFAMNTAIKNLFVRVPNPENQALLTSGIATVVDGNLQVEHEGQHLACFAGGMVGIGAKIFERGGDLQTARRLVDACIWAYNSMPSGIMPEHFKLMQCTGDCVWDEKKWHRQVLLAADATDMPAEEIIVKERLPPGFTSIIDPKYILRLDTSLHPRRCSTKFQLGLRRLNQSSSCTGLQVIASCKKRLGRSGKLLRSTRSPTSLSHHWKMLPLRNRRKPIGWKVSGQQRLSSTSTSSSATQV
jgi:hypothetical protein